MRFSLSLGRSLRWLELSESPLFTLLVIKRIIKADLNAAIHSAVIVDIIDAFNNGKVGGAFSCKDNSNTVAN
jgi:hypothetical protein